MHFKKTFEDDGFVYVLTVHPAANRTSHFYGTLPQYGYCCEWTIKGKQSYPGGSVQVTDDDCEVVVFPSIEAAVVGAKEFLSL